MAPAQAEGQHSRDRTSVGKKQQGERRNGRGKEREEGRRAEQGRDWAGPSLNFRRKRVQLQWFLEHMASRCKQARGFGWASKLGSFCRRFTWPGVWSGSKKVSPSTFKHPLPLFPPLSLPPPLLLPAVEMGLWAEFRSSRVGQEGECQ